MNVNTTENSLRPFQELAEKTDKFFNDFFVNVENYPISNNGGSETSCSQCEALKVRVKQTEDEIEALKTNSLILLLDLKYWIM